MQDNKNILIATVISMVILLGWTWFYEKPRIEKKEAQQKALVVKQKIEQKNITVQNIAKSVDLKAAKEEIFAMKNRKDILQEEENLRIKIESKSLHGSISLKGARFDNLTLAKYFEKNDKKDEVILLSPANSKDRYFADFGWVSS